MLGLDRLTTAFANMTPRRRALLGIGATGVVGGLALFAAAIFVMGSDEEAPPQGPEVVDIGNDLDKLDRFRDNVGTPSPAPPALAPLGDQPYRLVIEKLGVNAPVDTYGLDANAVPEVPTGAGANQTVAWYDFSAKPGTGSNAVFAGHVTWNGPAIFYKLAQLEGGDHVRLQGTDGTELVYTVSNVYSVDPTDPDSVKVMHPTDRDVVTLITCGGNYSDTSDPVFGGEYDQRLIVRAELAAVNGGAAPAAGG